MKMFQPRSIGAAMDYADAGGQALHVWQGNWPGPKPRCFVNGREWGHLIDRDHARLVATARRLGVHVVCVSRPGERGQHIDLCGRPLERAIEEAHAAERPEEKS